MTREEAIKILKEIDIPTNGDNEKERNMAFNMAIKALEQEPTTRNCFGCKYSKDKHLTFSAGPPSETRTHSLYPLPHPPLPITLKSSDTIEIDLSRSGT